MPENIRVLDPSAGLRAQLQVDDPTAPGNALSQLVNMWLQWRMEQEAKPVDMSMGGPVGEGGIGGIVRPSTPAAEGLHGFVERVWPSLAKAAGRAGDISLHYGGEKGLMEGAYFHRGTPLSRGRIYIPDIPSGETKPNAHQAIKSYLHELLHAIFLGKGYNRAVPPFKDEQALSMMLKSGMSNKRRSHWLHSDEPAHGALDAMALNVYRSMVNDPKFEKLSTSLH